MEELIAEVSRDQSTRIVHIGDFRPPKGSRLKFLDFNWPKLRKNGYQVRASAFWTRLAPIDFCTYGRSARC